MYKNLLNIMKSGRISKRELSRLLNVSPLTIFYKIGGKREFKLDEAIKIKNHINHVLKENYTIEEIFEKEEK